MLDIGLDTTIAADVQGPILESLGQIEKLAWVGIGFPMGSVATILLIGTAYGLFDIKYMIIGSFLLFEIGSAVCGAAPNMDAMIVGRVVAGIGGAGLYLGSGP
jgi:MFS family permease